MATTFETVDEYIASFPPERQAILEDVRGAMRRGAPGTEERISYGIPAFTLDGRYLIYFAGWKQHVSVYPIPETDDALEQAIAPYRAAKGTLRFPTRPADPLRPDRATCRGRARGTPATNGLTALGNRTGPRGVWAHE